MFAQLDQINSKEDSKIYRTLLKYTHTACTVALKARTHSTVPYTAGNTNVINICVKVKVTLEQATKAQLGSRGVALLFL
jgi:hypothetical protein